MKTWMIALSGIATLLLSGCGESTDNFNTSDAVGGYMILDTKSSNIPYPNDILISPETGYIHFETNTSDPAYSIKSALNTLDGFSTTSPVTVGVSCDIDTSTLPNHIMVVDITAMQPLTYGEAFVVTFNDGQLLILPRQPFKSSHRYLVILKRGITNTAGELIAPDYLTSLILRTTPLLNSDGTPTTILDKDPQTNIERLQKLEAIRQHTQQLITTAETMGIPRSEIINIWSFKTETIGKVAKAFADQNYSDAVLTLADKQITVEYMLGEVNRPTEGKVAIYEGNLSNLPYYLGIPATTNDPAPLTRTFHFEENQSLPTAEANITIPVLATLPNANSACTQPAEGWPVVIFQHGITQNRSALLAIAQSLEAICHAGIAIDLPLHGETNVSSPFYQKELERTFNLDYYTYDESAHLIAKVPDGKPDPSGQYYINLQSLLTARDNIRQTTSDLIALTNVLQSANGVRFDTTHISYVGHSLGAMSAFGYLAHHHLDTAVLVNPGGGIAQLLNNSETFGPILQTGLADSVGLDRNSDAFKKFLSTFVTMAQTIIDDADPLNYISDVVANQKILSFEVIPDHVIPNNLDRPENPHRFLLYGTEPLLRLMQAKSVSDYPLPALVPLTTNHTLTRFIEGTHRSFLVPDQPAVTTEMQSQMASFILYKGEQVKVNDATIIE